MLIFDQALGNLWDRELASILLRESLIDLPEDVDATINEGSGLLQQLELGPVGMPSPLPASPY